jgi:hypothetical protein
MVYYKLYWSQQTGINRTLNTSTWTYHRDNIYQILNMVLDFISIKTTDVYQCYILYSLGIIYWPHNRIVFDMFCLQFMIITFIFFILCNVNDLQILTVTTNAQFHLLCTSLLISSYKFRLNCHHQGATIHIIKTYSNKLVFNYNLYLLMRVSIVRLFYCCKFYYYRCYLPDDGS